MNTYVYVYIKKVNQTFMVQTLILPLIKGAAYLETTRCCYSEARHKNLPRKGPTGTPPK